MAELLRESGIEFEQINYFAEPLTTEIVRRLLYKSGLQPFEILRKKEKIFKELGISEQTPDEEITRLIVENPALLQRPIVEYGEKALLARPIEKVSELINLQTKTSR